MGQLTSLEDLAFVRAVRADETAHVLHEAQYLDARLLAEVYLLAHVQQRHLLRRGDHDGAVDAALLHEGVHAQVLVRRAGRGVAQEEVELAPVDVLEELLDQAVLLGAAPYDRVVAVGQQELYAHDRHIVHHPDRRPPEAADVYGLLLDAHHLRYGRSGDVGVENTDRAVWVRRECVRE